MKGYNQGINITRLTFSIDYFSPGVEDRFKMRKEWGLWDQWEGHCKSAEPWRSWAWQKDKVEKTIEMWETGIKSTGHDDWLNVENQRERESGITDDLQILAMGTGWTAEPGIKRGHVEEDTSLTRRAQWGSVLDALTLVCLLTHTSRGNWPFRRVREHPRTGMESQAHSDNSYTDLPSLPPLLDFTPTRFTATASQLVLLPLNSLS